MNSLKYSPSVTLKPNSNRSFSIDNPLVITVKTRINQNNTINLAPIFAPLGLSPKVIGQKITEFAETLHWSRKYITVRVIVKKRDMIDIKLANFSSQLIISHLGEVNNQHEISHDGNITHEQLIHVAQSKTRSKTAKTLTAKVKEVLGTCVSIGCKVQGEDPKVVLLQINNGTCPFKIPERIE